VKDESAYRAYCGGGGRIVDGEKRRLWMRVRAEKMRLAEAQYSCLHFFMDVV